MSTLYLLLNPSLSPSPTLQRYVKGASDGAGSYAIGASTGSVITGTVNAVNVSVWDFDFSSVTVGDYWAIVSGVSTPNGPAFPVRLTNIEVGADDSWGKLDAWLGAEATIPSAVSGLCNVLVAVTNGSGTALESCTVEATMDDANNMTDGLLQSKAVTSGTTDSDGYCTLTLIQYASFTLGGTYRLRVSDPNGKLLHNRRVRVPTASSANAEDLTAV